MAQSTVKLIVDAQNAIRPLQRVNEQTKALSSSTDKLKNRLNKSNRSIRESGRAAKSASGGFAALNKSLMPLLKALAAIAAIRFVFINAADIETQRKSLEVLTGSLSKTNKIIKELQDFGAVTPFKSSELIEKTKRLKAFGFETNELVDTTKRLADVAGATGADLQGIATAFGQIRAKGKLQQEENLQLLERGVDITTELKNITGLQGEAFEKAQRQGKIGADLVNQALINLTNEGGAFFEGASSQATTLNGKLSTLIDRTESLARTIGDILSPAIKKALDLATKGVTAIEKIFSRFGDVGNIGLGNFAKAEIDAQAQATRLTKLKFGDDIRLSGFAFTDEEKAAKKFLKEQTALLKKQFIEREKLRKKAYEESEIINEGNKKQADKTEKIIETNNAATAFNQTLESSVFILEEAITQTDGLKEKFMEIGQGIEDGIVSGLTDAVMGTKTLAEAATGVLNNLKRKLVEVAMQRAVSGIGNFFGNALSGIFGGGKNTFSGFPKAFDTSFDTSLLMANGGPVKAGQPYIVGERQPELFVPRTSGTIIPSVPTGGGNTTNNMITVNVDASGTSVQGSGSEADQLGGLIASVVQATIIDEQRAGGLLNR